MNIVKCNCASLLQITMTIIGLDYDFPEYSAFEVRLYVAPKRHLCLNVSVGLYHKTGRSLIETHSFDALGTKRIYTKRIHPFCCLLEFYPITMIFVCNNRVYKEN